MNHYHSDNTEIVADERSKPAQEKLAFCVVMMAGSALKSAQGRKLQQCHKQITMHQQGAYT